MFGMNVSIGSNRENTFETYKYFLEQLALFLWKFCCVFFFLIARSENKNRKNEHFLKKTRANWNKRVQNNRNVHVSSGWNSARNGKKNCNPTKEIQRLKHGTVCTKEIMCRYSEKTERTFFNWKISMLHNTDAYLLKETISGGLLKINIMPVCSRLFFLFAHSFLSFVVFALYDHFHSHTLHKCE